MLDSTSNFSGWDAAALNLNETALIDSAATISLLTSQAKASKASVQEPSKTVIIPDGKNLATTDTVLLNLPELPDAARRAFRLPSIMNNLLSVAELCDAGCTVLFENDKVSVKSKENKIILTGWRDSRNNLWRVPLVDGQKKAPLQPPSQAMKSNVDKPKQVSQANAATNLHHIGIRSPRHNVSTPSEKKSYLEALTAPKAKIAPLTPISPNASKSLTTLESLNKIRSPNGSAEKTHTQHLPSTKLATSTNADKEYSASMVIELEGSTDQQVTKVILANSVYDCDTQEQLIKFYHATYFSQTKDTLIKAARAGYLRGCPGFTQKGIRKHIGIEAATVKGHLNQKRKGYRSTKNNTPEAAPLDPMETVPQEVTNEKTNFLFATIFNIKAEGKIFSDQTGYFPRVSSRGIRYVMVFYIYDANYVRGIGIKNRSTSEFLRAYQEVHEDLKAKGYKPKLHKLDNECAKDVMEFIENQNAQFQFTPPDMHRTNSGEKGIQTWKNNFIAGLASLPKEFPIVHWCQLIPQANIVLNMCRPCRQNPLLSAHEALFGSYNFEATPMAPPGTQAFVHIKPANRATWGDHAEDAWYVGPALNHYRCTTVIMAKSSAKRISDTVKFKHHTTKLPNITPAERVERATKSLTSALQNQPDDAPNDYLMAVQ